MLAECCVETKRNWIMIEKDEQYYNLSLKRVGDFLNSFSHETSNEDEKSDNLPQIIDKELQKVIC